MKGSSLISNGKSVMRVGTPTDLANAVIKLMENDKAFKKAMHIALFNHQL